MTFLLACAGVYAIAYFSYHYGPKTRNPLWRELFSSGCVVLALAVWVLVVAG